MLVVDVRDGHQLVVGRDREVLVERLAETADEAPAAGDLSGHVLGCLLAVRAEAEGDIGGARIRIGALLRVVMSLLRSAASSSSTKNCGLISIAVGSCAWSWLAMVLPFGVRAFASQS
jgi:hypothetical protein